MGTDLPVGQQFSSQPLLGGPEPAQPNGRRPGLAGQTDRPTAGAASAQSNLRQQPQSAYQQSSNRQQSEATENREQQKWKNFDDEKYGGGAATAGKAQAALDAVAKGRTNKSNPVKDDHHSGYGARDTGPGSTSRDHGGTAHLSENSDAGMKGLSWLTQLIARMWPYITEAGEKKARAMLPDMLDMNKPTWMTTLKLNEFELGNVPPSINDVRVFPGTDPGAEDIFLEFDFEWRGDQNISLLLNPTPKFLQSVPGLSSVVNKLMTWTVGVSDISLKGRLRTTLIPLLFDMPVVGAVQVAFVDPPKLDFDLQMPSDSHGSGLLNFVEGWADAFITDSILSKYVLPDHYFAQIDKGAEDILTPEGVMEVWLLEAQDVPKMDFFGSGQPYGKMWLRPQSRRESPIKEGSNPKWGRDEAHYAMPVHTQLHQVLTVALLDHDSSGDDEIGRAHFSLGNLTPGETADLWLDINVPKKSGSENKGRERKRDKVLGFFMGAKGNQEKDVENCQIHIQLLFHPLHKATAKAVNQNQMKGKTADPNLIQDSEMKHLVEKFHLMEEMFGKKASDQMEANKQGKGTSNQAAAEAASGNASGSSQAQSSGSTAQSGNAATAQQPYMGSNYAPTGRVNSGFQPQAGGGGFQPGAGRGGLHPQAGGGNMRTMH